MTHRLAMLSDAVRSRLWPLPVLAIVLALVLGVVLPFVDTHLDSVVTGQPGAIQDVLFGGDADAARTVLSAVASSLITVTSLTFSLTVVTLQLASSQFSPRLLRTFTGDLFVQGTLGVFLATFTYSLVVLRRVRTANSAYAEFVPRLSVSFSFVLGVASVVMLVLFLAHLTGQIRPETMLREVHSDAQSVMDGIRRRQGSDEAPRRVPVDQLPAVPPGAHRLLAPQSGFITSIDTRALLRRCTEVDLVCMVERPIGRSVVEATPIGWVWASAAPAPSDLDELAADLVSKSVQTGHERTAVDDLGYGLRQLTDVAAKALSPGINDPTTAVHTLGHISALLCDLSGLDLDPVVASDDDGTLRVVLHQESFSRLVDGALTQLRRYGAGDPQVMSRLAQLLDELAYRCPSGRRDVVRGQVERLRATVAAQDFDDTELAQLERALAAADSTLGGRPVADRVEEQRR
ncbi:MAG: DUF2254 domain-containing protein [Actinomycetota bacterium]|nr:DUF2254 domain-containing protein [Actinomycetota bacterium]